MNGMVFTKFREKSVFFQSSLIHTLMRKLMNVLLMT